MKLAINRFIMLGIFCLAANAFASSPENVAKPDGKALPAFPGAEGYSMYSVGGRGGKVYEITTLESSGPGSLRAAIEAEGPRIVVFRVSGTIEGNFKLKNDKITIAGQTAPGDGICIKGSLKLDASDVIIRYIRVRANPTVGEVIVAMEIRMWKVL